MLLLPRWQQHKLCSSSDVAAVDIAEVAARSGSDLWDSSRPLAGIRVLKHQPDAPNPPDVQVLAMMFRADHAYQDNLANCMPSIFHLSAADVEFVSLITVVREFVATHIECRANGYAAAGHRMAEMILIELLRSIVAKRPEGTTGWLNGLGSPAISAAMTALHLEPRRRWTLNELADVSGLARPQFSFHFSRVVGQSPMSYVQSVRLQWAADEIMRGAAIKAVADEMGYSTPFGFRKAFVREYGVPPGRWRMDRSAAS
ncbi:AraC-like DNA-binding protein [Croceicoccus naphthovorans]|nr:AraC-like DNA-binding protein [Croceicoccus naphthovorans]